LKNNLIKLGRSSTLVSFPGCKEVWGLDCFSPGTPFPVHGHNCSFLGHLYPICYETKQEATPTTFILTASVPLAVRKALTTVLALQLVAITEALSKLVSQASPD